MGQTSKFSIILENNLNLRSREAAYIYENPKDVISVMSPDQLEKGFLQIEAAIAAGDHVAGWISYEAGLCLENKLQSLLPKKLKTPLIHMGVFDGRKTLDSQSIDHHWQKEEEKRGYSLTNLGLCQSRESYQNAFDKIQDYLNAGDIYQVNYTQKAKFQFEGSEASLFSALRNAQAVEFAAFIEADNVTVLSLSPELFIRKEGDRLTAKPMKGTGKRGRFDTEDIEQSRLLKESAKDRAENLMIVDLLRNDLSKLAKSGSVEVEKLFDVEKYRTLFTMTSTINALAKAELSPVEILRSIFPCGSVTGAPKIRAQEIISELEQEQRGIYTGAIGYFAPDGDACFSVPIRTVTIDKTGTGELGVGGAIVADSQVEKEYDECLLKAAFLSRTYPKFDLIESLGWTKEYGFDYLADHLDRLEKSAHYYAFLFDRNRILEELNDHVNYLEDDGSRFKVRLLLSKGGSVSISSEKITTSDADELPNITFASKHIDSNDPIFFHKTTQRNLYESELLEKKHSTGCFDVIFTNEKDEITEGSFTNIFIKKNGVFLTPKRECGLLGGIYRQQMLDNPDIKTSEEVIFRHDLENADQIFLCNAVRGLFEVKLLKSP